MFWHIPWPNPESFSICPWREELLEGMLGSTILGFHTRFHCQNFVETVDRHLEARIERESSTISYGGQLTRVESYPISIQWPPEWIDSQLSVSLCRAKVLRIERLPDDVLLGDDPASERWRAEYLYSRAATIYGGSAEIQRNIVARRLLDLGAEA
jgi:trehalose 6-phosphate synthase